MSKQSCSAREKRQVTIMRVAQRLDPPPTYISSEFEAKCGSMRLSAAQPRSEHPYHRAQGFIGCLPRYCPLTLQVTRYLN